MQEDAKLYSTINDMSRAELGAVILGAGYALPDNKSKDSLRDVVRSLYQSEAIMRALIAASLALALSGCVNISGNSFTTCAPSAADAIFGPLDVPQRAPKGLRIVPSASLGQCSTDSECEAQCREDLRPDEDPAICNI